MTIPVLVIRSMSGTGYGTAPGISLLLVDLIMDIKLAVTVFGVVFLAELGDKTQLATLLFSAKSPDRLISVFLGSSAALVLASAIGVLAGALVAQYVSPKLLSYTAGAGFMLIGALTIWQAAAAG